MGLPQARVATSLPTLLAATVRLKTTTLSSATAHPEQVETPESDEDQGARAHAQQQYDCFQHGRITPLVSQKHARLSQFCHHSVAASARTKPFSGATKTS
jgi:hypothetical protein